MPISFFESNFEYLNHQVKQRIAPLTLKALAAMGGGGGVTSVEVFADNLWSSKLLL